MKASGVFKNLVILLVAVSLYTTVEAKGRLLAQNDDDELSLDLDAEDEAATAPSDNGAQTDDLGIDELEADIPAENAPAPNLPPETPVQDVAPQNATAPETPPPPAAEPTQPDAPSVTVTALDFKANENGGTVVIKTTGTATYNTRVGADGRQLIVDIENATLPAKFKRPFNTKDFSGAIGLINAYQEKGSKTARIIIQLKQPIQPTVTQEGGSIMVMALAGGDTPPADDQVAAPEPPAEEPVVVEEAPVQAAAGDSNQALSGKTLDEFLAGEMKFYGSPISIQVKDGDLRDVFNFISEESGLNLVLADDVGGKISLKLREIPWDQALIVVMQAKQLGYLRQGNIIRIAPLRSIRAETDQTRELIEAQKSLQPTRVKIFPISYAQSKDLVPQVQQFLSDKRGKVQADARTNSLVVTDTADVLAKVGKIIQSLDTQTPQVMIEGKIIEAKDNWSRSVGISWNIVNGARSLGNLNRSGVPSATFAAAADSPNLSLGTFGLINDFDTLTSTIQLGEAEGNTKILSSPRIVAINNQKASIQQTQETPIQTTVVTSGGGASTSVSFKQAKLQLDVTPQITAEGGVLLSISVLQEFFGSSTPVGGATTGSSVAVPVESRKADTTILVKNGQTAVVGGIYSSNDTENGEGIPFLRKIPLIGRLFGSETLVKAKNELMIFLSPRILNQMEAFGSNTTVE